MNLLKRIAAIGSVPSDEALISYQKRFLVYQGSAMSMGGILWGTLLVVANVAPPAIIPYGYVILTALNFWFFHKTKRFVFARHLQTFISLLLPFTLQWWLGGFEQSGAVMLWSILALASSATYLDARSSIFWLIAFIVFTLISFFSDDYFRTTFSNNWQSNITRIFLLVNILCNGTVIFLLFLYYVEVQKSITKELMQTYTKLLSSEKLAALGQISAGVAHEVNTPLGAIKSSAEESSVAFYEIITKLPGILDRMSKEEKDCFIEFITTTVPNKESLTTIEEREKKKDLKGELEKMGVENARFISDRLVQVGIYEVKPALARLSTVKGFEDIVMVTYNLLNQQKNNKTIIMAVDKASRVVKALKTYLHTTQTAAPESMNLRENIETVLTIYHNRLKQGITVVKQYDDVPNVDIFPDQMNQVWTNLIVNAVQAMDNKGTLTIGIRRDGDYVVVSIKDTGKGIPKDIRAKIFEPFFTTKVSGEGSGLGLDIIKKILDSNKGQISFESEEGVGTTFYVKIPINIEK